MIKEIERVFNISTSTIKNVGDTVKIIGSTIDMIGKTLNSLLPEIAKKDQLKKLEEKYKQDMKIARKIENITNTSPQSEEEKIQKDNELKKYFNILFGR